MSGPLKNARQERFAQELAKGKSQLDAYKAAGYRPDRGAATRLSANISVATRVEELKARAAAKVEITVADIARQLDEDREFAKECGQAGAAVSASLGKAKVLGLIVDRQEHTGRNGGPIEYRNLEEEEIDARLRALAEKHAGSDRPLAH
jgi:phage terminase small subunit